METSFLLHADEDAGADEEEPENNELGHRPDRLDAFPEVEPWVLSIVDRIVWIHSEG